MNIFNFLIETFHEKVTEKSPFPIIILSILITGSMQLFMKKRYNKFFSDRSERVQKELGPAKYKVNMKINILTPSMVNDTFFVTAVYLNHAEKFYLYDIEDENDGTEYSNIPEKFLCPINPHGLAVNNVSYSDLMSTLTSIKKTDHEISW